MNSRNFLPVTRRRKHLSYCTLILSCPGDNASHPDDSHVTVRYADKLFPKTPPRPVLRPHHLKPFSAADKKKKKDGDGDNDNSKTGNDNDNDSIPDLASLSDSSCMRGAFDEGDDDEDLDMEDEENEDADEGEEEEVFDEHAALDENERVDFDTETKLVKKSLHKVGDIQML
ncbi:hypothetical protein R3P38DRAFT_2793791 [Favolaschia claudopus]|uniref:Uncharacterized protein n=1 Tax=Favolaschia claudopus TaxID=2862362 RepID=A0AAW0AC17_9AGAR